MRMRDRFMRIKTFKKSFKDQKKGRNSGMDFVKICKMNSRGNVAAQKQSVKES